MKYNILHLDPDEHVVFVVRKHWIVFVGYASALIFMAFLPSVLLPLFNIFLSTVPGINFNFIKYFGGNIDALLLFLYCLWLLVLWISFFVYWTKYYLDAWYVTDKRIIIVDQKRLFNREISNVRFDRIQDVSVNVPGFLSTLLDFGNIEVQTASEDVCEFKMKMIRHPEKVRQIIFSKHNEIGDKGSNVLESTGV